MKPRMLWFVSAGLLAAETAVAQWVQPEPSHLATPDVAKIAGRACGKELPTVKVGGQDSQTLFYSGRAFARTRCDDEGVYYQGCADVSWDPTGTRITYKVLWQEKITRPPPQVEDQTDIGKRCLGTAEVM